MQAMIRLLQFSFYQFKIRILGIFCTSEKKMPNINDEKYSPRVKRHNDIYRDEESIICTKTTWGVSAKLSNGIGLSGQQCSGQQDVNNLQPLLFFKDRWYNSIGNYSFFFFLLSNGL